jgi:hypothetical protein
MRQAMIDEAAIPVPTVWRYAASAKNRGAILWSATISHAGAHQHA